MLALVIETWVWFTAVVVVGIARFISRILHLGSVKSLQIDDWLMVFALCAYTTLIVTINIVADKSTNLLPPGFDEATLTHADKDAREYGSKLVLVVEQCMCLTIWAVKACILIMYSRLTIGRKEHRWLNILMGYVAFSFVFMEVFYLGVWCRPINLYWAVPTPNIQCSAATNHLITNAVFNISSDVIMLSIALPMFIRSRLPLRKKMVLVGIFGLGSFVLLSAILNKYYSFTQPFGSLWTFWYTREASTALLVANLPFMWTLLRRMFNLTSLDGTSRANSVGQSFARRRGGTSKKGTQTGIDTKTGRQYSSPRPEIENGRGKVTTTWETNYSTYELQKPAPCAIHRQASASTSERPLSPMSSRDYFREPYEDEDVEEYEERRFEARRLSA